MDEVDKMKRIFGRKKDEIAQENVHLCTVPCAK
jgi:hypothetical protein